MTWALRAGRIAVVIAVIFFLAATAALAGSPRSDRDAASAAPSVRMPTKWITTPARILKETALVRHRIEKIGETALVGFGVDLLTRSIRWVRQLGLVRVTPQGTPRAGGV